MSALLYLLTYLRHHANDSASCCSLASGAVPPAYRTHGTPSAPLACGGPTAAESLWTGRRSAGRASRTHRAAPRAKWAGPWSSGRPHGHLVATCDPGQSSHAALRAARGGASAGRGWRPRRRPRYRCEGNRPPVRHMGTKMSNCVCAFGCVRLCACVRVMCSGRPPSVQVSWRRAGCAARPATARGGRAAPAA